MSIFGAGEIAGLLKDVIDRAWPDPAQKAEAMLKVQELDNQLAQGQMAINQVEAASDSIFVAGWRPFVGWMGGIGFAWQVFLQPLIMFILAACGITYTLPVFDTSLLETVLLGILGLRGVEKMADKGHLPWQQ